MTFAGTSNETTVAEDAGTVTIGLPNDVTISNDLTVSGNLVVTGNTTQTGSLLSNSNFQALSQKTSGNSTDFGFYGKYVESTTTKYAGLFYDASTDNSFRLFADTQTQPSTTVNTSATGYVAAGLVIGALTTSGITIGSTAVTSTAAELNILDGVTATATELNLLDGATANTVVNSKAVIYGSSCELKGTLSTAAQTNVTSLGTLTTLTVDDITINGSTISDSADITLDIGGDIILDADGGNITFKDGGTAIGDFSNSSSDFVITSSVQDKDIIFKGDDNGSAITALTLDMSDSGAAFFNHNVGIGTSAVNTVASENTAVQIGDVSEAKSLLTLAGTTNGAIYFADSDSGAARYDGFLVYDHGDRALTLGSNGVEKARFTSAGFAIGTTTATATVTVSGNAVGTMITDNDGSFDMTAGNNFKCTPSGNFTLTFTNIISQSGNILLVNSGGHTVSAHSNSKVDANLLATVSTAGTYLLSYFSDGTDVFLTNSAAYT